MDLFNDLPEPKNSCDTATSKSDDELNENNKREISESNESPNKKLNTNLKTNSMQKEVLKFTGLFAEKQGERDSMQDRHVIIEDFKKYLDNTPSDLESLTYYAIFDGHAGVRAAEHCAENMHIILADKLSKAFLMKANLSQVEKEMKRYFIETFKQCDDEFLKKAAKNKPSWKDGTTVTIVLILNQTLYTANIGDSKAIICKDKENVSDSENPQQQVIELTKEHSASVYEERQRVQKCGGQVRDGRILGAIEVSRSIGDGPYKAYGVTCLPDMRKCQLNSLYKFIVIACDGLWKSFTNEEVVKQINNVYNRQKEMYKDEELGTNQIYQKCCEKLTVEAVKKLSADNVTVIIVSIQ